MIYEDKRHRAAVFALRAGWPRSLKDVHESELLVMVRTVAKELTAAHPKPEPVETQPEASTPSEDAVEREDRVIALLDDVERALKTKGIWGRHFAANAIRTVLSNTQPQAPSEAVRSMDESGSPESVGCIAQAWIGERGKEAAGIYGADRVELVYEPAKALILYVDRKPMNVATIWRDPMNFSQLVRWSATIGNPAATDTQPVAGGGALNTSAQPVSKTPESEQVAGGLAASPTGVEE